ncbi:MAG: pyruvate carboxylase [Lactobacillales bacterium]|jgi:pyruvate carboxylase|nr:pyruvate carboxylase [Lactobacillales bacterium]
MKKVLVANRGEIAIRVFRACSELGLKTVGIYAAEDAYSVHRFKADEAYLVGEGKKPVEAYLDIQGIIAIAKESGADAIHPGYGLLSENLEFATECEKAGIKFVGPTLHHLDIFGDKIKAKEASVAAGIQSIPGTDGPVANIGEVLDFANSHGYPIMIKAALGGGGRGMRVARDEKEAIDGFERARSEALTAFGSDEVYVEKYIGDPQHIEVQILGDEHGNVIHLFERDCSVQRRHQKVVEVAPCVSLPEEKRIEICDAAVKLMKHVGYINAGTVEFLYESGNFYFIEVNPRVQVEHTITELITGVDIVRSQLLIAQGQDIHKDLKIPTQDKILLNGAAIQCRITTEDPLKGFLPDIGKIDTYRSPGGFGVRLDTANAFAGSVITPFFDSLLVKVCTHSLDFNSAVEKMDRCLREFRIRGVKTNIPFLLNVVNSDEFKSGEAKTTFIDNTPSLFEFSENRDRGTKTLNYLGEITVNGYPGIERRNETKAIHTRYPKKLEVKENVVTAKNIFDERGPEGLTKWIKEQPNVLLTDTTMRDAHQSLLATRVRTKDFENIATLTEQGLPELFSNECWGGATFDVAYRFLSESPWARLRKIREAQPNTLLQMLFRGSNAVGYQNYPDNVIAEFIKESRAQGVDVFRIFDSLNWVKQIERSIQVVRDVDGFAEASMCYTGDILDPNRQKYSIQYYKDLAKELEALGAHAIAIKDMAGLLKPQASYTLISELKEVTDLPLHLHTHDTAGSGNITYSAAVKAGVDIVDVAFSAMSGATSEPSMAALYYTLLHGSRMPDINIDNAQQLNHYWEDIRRTYVQFDKAISAPQTEVYYHEMPGGQYTNLQQQAAAVGLADRFDDVKEMYRQVNLMFGDITKVTPSSKVVGDMALFMVQNNLSEDDVYERGMEISFPESVISFFLGDLGQPEGGFPEELQKIVLKGRIDEAYTVRPGELAKTVDFEEVRRELSETIGRDATHEEVLSYLMYPKVFLDFVKTNELYGDVTLLDTPTFFNGLELGETIEVQIERGKTLIIRLDEIGEADAEGNRVIYFSLNGQRREIIIKDRTVKTNVTARQKADSHNKNHVGASMPGTVLKVMVNSGDEVKAGDVLVVTEAMKMEMAIEAVFDGVIERVHVQAGEAIQVDDLLLEVKPKA